MLPRIPFGCAAPRIVDRDYGQVGPGARGQPVDLLCTSVRRPGAPARGPRRVSPTSVAAGSSRVARTPATRGESSRCPLPQFAACRARSPRIGLQLNKARVATTEVE